VRSINQLVWFGNCGGVVELVVVVVSCVVGGWWLMMLGWVWGFVSFRWLRGRCTYFRVAFVARGRLT
jgi:hypothetical protein